MRSVFRVELDMSRNLLFLVLAFASCSATMHAQVVINNPQNLDLPRGKANVIYQMTLRVLKENFDVGEISGLYPVTLTLGAEEERYVEDEDNKVDAIFLKKWDEKKFAISVMRLALEHLVDRSCRNEMVSEILTRSDVIVPAVQKRH
jgi:hypothetical protein